MAKSNGKKAEKPPKKQHHKGRNSVSGEVHDLHTLANHCLQKISNKN